MKTHLAIIDLDDTLLGPDKRVSPENRAALDRLRAEGFEIVVASGRHHHNITVLQEAIGPLNWVISANGAIVRHLPTDQVLYELTLGEADALSIYELARSGDYTVVAYHRDGAYTEVQNEWTAAYKRVSGHFPEKGDLRALAARGLQKVILMQDPAIITAAKPSVVKVFGSRFYVVETEPEMIEFLSPRSNKRLGAQSVALQLGIPAENVAAFGDGFNDLELLGWAGLSVAMGHGKEAAQRAARFVTPPGPPETAFARGAELVLEALEADEESEEEIAA